MRKASPPQRVQEASLQMEYTDELIRNRPNRLIEAEISSGTAITQVPSEAGNVLTQIRVDTRTRIARIVEVIIRKREARHRRERGALRFFQSKRCLAVRQTAVRRAQRSVGIWLRKCGRYAGDRNPAVVVGLVAVIGDRNGGRIGAIARREGYLVRDRQTGAQGAADHGVIVIRIGVDFIFLRIDIETRRQPLTEEIGLGEGIGHATRIFPVGHGEAGKFSAAHEIRFGNRDFGDEPFRRRIATRDRE